MELKRLLERAKKEQVPNDIIERSLKRVTSGGTEDYLDVRYEGFGPGASTLIVECLTDNINRTASFVRHAFSKASSKLGVLGSVSYMYKQVYFLEISKIKEEELLNFLIENNQDFIDIIKEENIILYVEPQKGNMIRELFSTTKKPYEVLNEGLIMVPDLSIELSSSDLEEFKKLLSLLEDIDDVKEVFHNVNNEF